MLPTLERRRRRLQAHGSALIAKGDNRTRARCLAIFAVILFTSGCSFFESAKTPATAGETTDGDGGELSGETAPTSSTLPPLLGLAEAAEDPAFDGGNSAVEVTAAMEVLLSNELDFNAPGIADGVGECGAIDGGAISQLLGQDVIVVPQRAALTPAPYLTCQLSAASDSGVTVGYVHVSPDEGGFEAWFLTNPAADLTPLVSPGDTAGWTEGSATEDFFSIVVVEQGGTQAALEFRNFEGGSFSPGNIPGMIGALSQATADLAA